MLEAVLFERILFIFYKQIAKHLLAHHLRFQEIIPVSIALNDFHYYCFSSSDTMLVPSMGGRGGGGRWEAGVEEDDGRGRLELEEGEGGGYARHLA